MGAWSQQHLWDSSWPSFTSQERGQKGKISEAASNSGTLNDGPQLETLGVRAVCPFWWTAELGQSSCSGWAPHEAGRVTLPWHLSLGTVPSPTLPAAATARPGQLDLSQALTHEGHKK